ncbi:hypothetical protein COX22_03055 [Candidatus Falkowbacteria bacterium CG23_combo_of_CG06-09_8_20_14_all_49_15]|uniref:Uncharacterized protein n=1 Tax=Candidatus Falkowbacteria bacterium CG23_combo_of_CG06-09_8_20_14_all_49_15 TaxID=1974572 RepID=A0A2G9ZKF9_9BACT|nr:MAG: hypothetical protein COX22_03055 [Candidatus Falkowbacteria bacterium CG23_combo_of_CG06-09_8_20_14_all_49_15]
MILINRKIINKKNMPENANVNTAQPETGKKQFLSPKIWLGGGLGLLLIALGAYLFFRASGSGEEDFGAGEKRIYEIAIVVRGQQNPDPAEDRKNSLKAGDALIAQGEGHQWSVTEKTSYLILKMNLTDKQAEALTRPEEVEIAFSDLSAEEQKRIEEEKALAEKEGRDYTEETRRETVRARAYRVKIEKLPPFNPDLLPAGQPFLDQVYDWAMVEKKPKIK